MLQYVFALKNSPLYKFRKRLFFKMIYDDFNQEDRFQLMFFIVFFFKRIIYAVVLAFMSNIKIGPLNIYMFIVTLIPLLYYSYALPFKSRYLNALLCLNEFSEFVTADVILHYKDQWIDDEEFFGYAVFLIKYITIWILINLAALLIHILIALIQLCFGLFTFKQGQFIEKQEETESSETSEE